MAIDKRAYLKPTVSDLGDLRALTSASKMTANGNDVEEGNGPNNDS